MHPPTQCKNNKLHAFTAAFRLKLGDSLHRSAHGDGLWFLLTLLQTTFCVGQQLVPVGNNFHMRCQQQTSRMAAWLGAHQSVTDKCSEQPCAYCVLDICHRATMEQAADAYRNEHHRLVSTKQNNPWSFWMRSVAWNQIYARHMAALTPLGPGPWDNMRAAAGTPAEIAPNVPMELAPSMVASWSHCCEPSRGPRCPPMRGSVASSSAAQAPDVLRSPGPRNCDVKWQYQGGKKRKWTDYDMEFQEDLDYAAYSARESVDLIIDQWRYTVNFEKMQQYLHEVGTIRNVRQVPVDEDEE
jgi:hypothetical protein